MRTLFLSDIHLGYRHARARELNEFLVGVEAENIVLVGDIVDALSLARRVFWSAEHTQVVRTLLARGRAGTRLVYIPGNHDESLGVFAEMLQGQFEVHREWVHRTARGERLLVLHGDQFDRIVSCSPWLTRLGDALYEVSVRLSDGVNNLRRALGKAYWPLAERLKLSIPTSVRYIEKFEQVAAGHARSQGYDGVVCGHIHRANLRHIEGTLYCNTGDWVESCSALVEAPGGELKLLRWPHAAGAVRRRSAALVADRVAVSRSSAMIVRMSARATGTGS
ncbi:MAG TPA: UDP-2,3-diacylglucosamine diphosphatase [Steroidobacteraceae bacterium]|nr:UDP-2,3-diacylglucosamine diphosphatase [Steroidobacteraceae bacterium]